MMGMIRVYAAGSFGVYDYKFSAMEHGHVAAVEEAIELLTKTMLPRALEKDTRLAGQGHRPDHGFGPTVTKALGEEWDDGKKKTVDSAD